MTKKLYKASSRPTSLMDVFISKLAVRDSKRSRQLLKLVAATGPYLLMSKRASHTGLLALLMSEALSLGSDFIKLCLQMGADVDILLNLTYGLDHLKPSPLVYSSGMLTLHHNPDLAISRCLIQHGADVDIQHGRPLREACMNIYLPHQRQIVEMLLQAGADPLITLDVAKHHLKLSQKKNYKESSIYYASSYAYLLTLNLLTKLHEERQLSKPDYIINVRKRLGRIERLLDCPIYNLHELEPGVWEDRRYSTVFVEVCYLIMLASELLDSSMINSFVNNIPSPKLSNMSTFWINSSKTTNMVWDNILDVRKMSSYVQSIYLKINEHGRRITNLIDL